MDLGSEEAAENHGATEADRNTHGGGLHLGGGEGGTGEREVMKMSVWIAFFILFYYSIFLSFADGYLEKVWQHGGSSG